MTPPVCTLVVAIASTAICTELPKILASTTKRGGILSESVDEEEKEPICKPGEVTLFSRMIPHILYARPHHE